MTDPLTGDATLVRNVNVTDVHGPFDPITPANEETEPAPAADDTSPDETVQRA